VGRILAVITLFVFVNSTIFAQEGTSSASVARSRALSNLNNPNSYRPIETFVAPDEVAVEEFVNYHRHRLPLPKAGKSVALDTRWGNDRVSRAQKEAVLQIGFTTDSVNERTDLRPLNLSLVIDKSGSMASADKLSRVKESLQKMIGQLRRDDIVSIVVFDTTASVLCAAQRVGNGRSLRRAINSLRPGSSTNLHAGLMLGYKEAQKNYERNSTNRVILLTDGIANTGTTDPKRIAFESSEFNGQGIDLSTIGVGIDLDRALLRTLSKQGRGLFHFVADAHDIEKVFVNEVQSLISPVARRVDLTVQFDPRLEVKNVYGYEPRFGRNRVSIPIDDMNSGLTQLVLMKFRLKNSGAIGRSYPVNIKLSYLDIKTRKRITQTQTTNLYVTGRTTDFLVDSMVKKNFTIAELAQSLYEMSEAAKQKKYRNALSLLENSVAETNQRYPNMQDKDIGFILKIVEDYRLNLRKLSGNKYDDDCSKCE